MTFQNPLDGCLDTEQMTAALRLKSIASLRNHHLPKIKATCDTFKIGRNIYVDAKDFARYINSMKERPNRGA